MPIHRTWFQVMLVGVVLFVGAEQALKLTGNINYVPTVIMVGAFAIPMTMVAYFYGRERTLDRLMHPEAPLIPVVTCFLIGGVMSTVVAGFLEYEVLTNLSVGGLLAVGLIEEAAKLLFPFGLYMSGRYRSPVDGMLFGITSGMGFAALETMGYGLVSLLQSRGDVGVLQEVLLVRGLLSPVGHAAWTALVCGALWQARERTGKTINAGVLWTYLLAVVLHAFWDLAGSSGSALISFVGFIIVGGVSLFLLLRKWRQAQRTPQPANS